MDADEITRIEATRFCRIAASVRKFREIVRHAREMHDILLRGRWSAPSECAATPSATQVDELENCAGRVVKRCQG